MFKDKLQIVLNKYKESHQDINLLAVMKMDDLVDKWSIVVAADWITSDNTREVFNNFVTLIKAELNKEELDSIARLGIFSADEHLVSELLKYKSGTVITDTKVNGNRIYEGYIVQSSSVLEAVQ